LYAPVAPGPLGLKLEDLLSPGAKTSLGNIT
jgi:hypothetical protein